MKYYEPRYISKSFQKEKLINLDELEKNWRLKDAVLEFDKLILLGNPGSGKSIELEHLFEVLWGKQNETKLVPIRLNLKNFRTGVNFEDLIQYKDWKTLNRVVFILDGLDEIPNIQDFVSALELFITNNSSTSSKFVLSCRTNIYQKYLIQISGFDVFNLNELTVEQVNSILKNAFDIHVEIGSDRIKENPLFFTPFFLAAVSRYFKKNKSFPSSNSELWEIFIENTLAEEPRKMIKREELVVPKLKHNLSILALVNEFRQQNSITDDELYQLVGDYYSDFCNNPLIESTFERNHEFTHRQYQEYFVAKTLSKLPFEQLIDTICIPKTEFLLPTLSNVISFLIALIDDAKKKDKLINWLKRNAIETLIHSDSDRIDDNMRNEVFQSYFQKQCVEQNFWVSTNSSINNDALARFGDTLINSKYLMGFISDSSAHYRVRRSAIELIAHFRSVNDDKLKDLFFHLLSDHTIESGEKSLLIRSFKQLNYHLKYDGLVDQLLDQFQNETNASINSALISIISGLEEPENYIDFIFNEFLLLNGLNKRNEQDNTIRGTDWVINELILKFTVPANFLKFLGVFIIKDRRFKYRDGYTERLNERFIELNKKNLDLLALLLDQLRDLDPYRSPFDEQLLTKIIRSTQQELEAHEFLMEIKPFSELKWFLATISTEETIDYLTDNFDLLESADGHCEGFRNILSSHGLYELAKKWESSLINKGYEFRDLLQSREFYEKLPELRKQSKLKDFSALLDKGKLIKRIEEFYQRCSVEALDRGSYFSLEREYFKSRENPYINDLPIEMTFLQNWLDREKSKSIGDILSSLETDKLEYLNLIKEQYQDLFGLESKLDLDIQGIHKISELINEEISSFELEDLLVYLDSNRFRYKFSDARQKLQFIDTVFFFQEQTKFNIRLNEDFLLYSLEYYKMDTADPEDEGFKSIIEQIGDFQKVRNRIAENIRRSIFSFPNARHVHFALNNSFHEVYDDIRSSLLQDKSLYQGDKTLHLYLKQTKDQDLLKEHARDMSTQSSWTCIRILCDNEELKDRDFVLPLLEQQMSDRNSEFWGNALRLMFTLNQEKAIIEFINNFDPNLVQIITYTDLEKYDVVPDDDFSFIEKLFNQIFSTSNDDHLFHYNLKFLETYLINISKRTDYYDRLKSQLEVIREKEEVKADDTKFFYINLFIENAKKSWISQLSNPMSFKDAKVAAEQILSVTH